MGKNGKYEIQLSQFIYLAGRGREGLGQHWQLAQKRETTISFVIPYK